MLTAFLVVGGDSISRTPWQLDVVMFLPVEVMSALSGMEDLRQQVSFLPYASMYMWRVPEV